MNYVGWNLLSIWCYLPGIQFNRQTNKFVSNMTYSAPFQFKAFPRLEFKNTYYEPFYPGQALNQLDNGVPQRSKKESLSWSAKWKWNKKYEWLKVKFWLCKRPALKLKALNLNWKILEVKSNQLYQSHHTGKTWEAKNHVQNPFQETKQACPRPQLLWGGRGLLIPSHH